MSCLLTVCSPSEGGAAAPARAWLMGGKMHLYYERQNVQLYLGDCISTLESLVRERGPFVDLVFADPPYNLSNDGITCIAGRMVSVNKGEWDRSRGAEEDHEFNLSWLRACRNALKADGAIWVSGTTHVIHSVGYAMQQLGYRLLADVVWFKVNPPPNIACRTFTHAHETLIWAARDRKARYTFNYREMKAMAGHKQMKALWPIISEEELPEWIWAITPPSLREKRYGKHPTQKPEALLERCITATSRPDQLVLDPFCGHGATGVAAARLGRRFVGIDTEESYLEVAARRIEVALARSEHEPANRG